MFASLINPQPDSVASGPLDEKCHTESKAAELPRQVEISLDRLDHRREDIEPAAPSQELG